MQAGLFDSGPLFDPQVLARYLDDRRVDIVPDLDARRAALREWVSSPALADGEATEGALEQAFNSTVLARVLGYSLFPAPQGGTAHAWPKPSSDVTGIGRTPDVILGRFTPGEGAQLRAVLELKRPGVDLDAPQARRRSETPVEQGFDYGRRIVGVRWVLVSDMRSIRLYSVESPRSFESFDIEGCALDSSEGERQFRRLHFLLHREHLVGDGGEAPTGKLLAKSAHRHLAVCDAFYSVYHQVRGDLLDAISEACDRQGIEATRWDVIEAAQRLLDRLIFVHYCEDSPGELLRSNLLRDTVEAAYRRPARSSTKVYDALRDLFAVIDQGSLPGADIAVTAYNGELFKPHRILDAIDLPDSLHLKLYTAKESTGATRRVKGVWGLHGFDFWRELNEHLLGHIFEESLSDVVALAGGHVAGSGEKVALRKRHGIYYTSQILAEFLTSSALADLRRECRGEPPDAEDGWRAWFDDHLQWLAGLRILDPACGSGAFIVAAYEALLSEHLRSKDALAMARRRVEGPLLDRIKGISEAALLRDCIYGADLLPQAVEIAKLALWLRSTRGRQRVADLSQNLVAGDSLRVDEITKQMRHGDRKFDLVVGNPPWGADLDPESYSSACRFLSVDLEPAWDSWELFVLLGLRLLRDGGRLALVLPDTLFSPEKRRLRELLLDQAQIERIHNLGSDWFGPSVRMGTVILQARAGRPLVPRPFPALVLTGERRRDAIAGLLPLSQLETRDARSIPQARCVRHAERMIEVFRSGEDDAIIQRMEARSVRLGDLCWRGRGEEINKAGVLWRCPSCLALTTPGRKSKERILPTICERCRYQIAESAADEVRMVVDSREAGGHLAAPWITGDDIARRYAVAEPHGMFRLDLDGWKYKPDAVFLDRKILIRQAGVGINATIDDTGARCPQSVYVYRVHPHLMEEGYGHHYVLAALLCRTMNYLVLKRFSELDPARAFAKLTHARLEDLPVPRVDRSIPEHRRAVRLIQMDVDDLLSGKARLGGPEDIEIEQELRKLWGISPEEGAYINREFGDASPGQVVSELFPDGVPARTPIVPLLAP